MATVCSFCGQELPRGGDARFCTHCGTPVPDASSSSPDAQVGKHNIPLTNHMYNNKTTLNPNLGWHEQLAKQPPAKSAQSQDSNVTPWVGLSAGSDTGNVTPWVGLPAQDALIKSSTEPEAHPSQDVEELETLPFATQHPDASAVDAESSIEDFPTSIMSTASLSPDAQVEDFPTSRLQSNVQQPQPYPSRPPMASSRPISSPDNMPSVHVPAGVALDGRHFGTQATGTRPPLRAARRQKRSWLVGIIAAVVLLILAIGCWIILAQPFTVSANTDPTQTTSSAPLGLTITYPSGWTTTQTATTLTLADSSQTAQMKIVQSANDNTDSASYLKQQATKLGMTDAKAGASASFAGSSWQQTHGDFVIDGAGYIGTIYVTTHNNHLYTLTQIAPKVTFQDEESLIFAPARASLKFK